MLHPLKGQLSCPLPGPHPLNPINFPNHLPTVPRDAQGQPGITGRGRVSGQVTRTKPPNFYTSQAFFGDSFAPSFMAAHRPTTTTTTAVPRILTSFDRNWLEANANPRVRARCCSLSLDLSHCQGPGPQSRCYLLSQPERKYHRAEDREDASS